MNTQISILVKNESFVSRLFSTTFGIFRKMPVDIVIDDPNAAPQRLKASKEPYLIDLAPGNHQILFTDPRAKKKARSKAIVGAMMGAAAGAAYGGSIFGGAAAGADAFSGASAKDGVLSFSLQEGDVLKVSAQPKRNGSVKVKILKDKN